MSLRLSCALKLYIFEPLYLQDNGVKVVDPMGEMLAKDWEVYASLISNCRSVQSTGFYMIMPVRLVTMCVGFYSC